MFPALLCNSATIRDYCMTNCTNELIWFEICSYIKYQVSSIKYQVSSIKYQVSSIKYQVSNKYIINVTRFLNEII
jgi:hypothetical protein